MKSLTSTRPRHRFETSKFYFHLLRLTDEEYRELRANSFPIEYDELFLCRLAHQSPNKPDSLNLPKLLLLLEKEFGPSSQLYDSWRQGFSFPCLLEVQKAIGSLHYILKIADYRGGAEFQLYRVINDLKYISENRDTYHKPIVDELSEIEIQHIIGYLWGFYEGYARFYVRSEPEITPFFRYIGASNLVYGYWDNEFVEQFFESEEDRCKLLDKLERECGEAPKSDLDQICATNEMILKILAS
jgi:hypothetical protein